MPKQEKVRNIENPAGQLTFLSMPELEPKRFLSKYTALVSLLKLKLTPAEYRRELSIIKKIKNKGFTEKQIYGAFNYHVFTKKSIITSFALFLWEDCKLVKEAVPFLNQIRQEVVVVPLDDKDYREDKSFTPIPKTIIDFLM